MDKNFEILLSGTFGALLATLLSVWYQHFSEQIRIRKDTMRAVMEWVDNIYSCLQAMQVHKERGYTGKSPSLSEEEYRFMSNEVRTLLLSNRIATEVVCVYGEGDVLQKINALQGELRNAASILWTAKKETWPNASKEIMRIFQEKIDPIIARVMGDFLDSTGKISISRRAQVPAKIKKIIAKEGLLLVSVTLMAWFISHADYYQQLIYNSGLCSVKNIEGVNIAKVAGNNPTLEVSLRTELVNHKIFIYGFIFIFLGYFFFRFIIWAMKTLRQKP